MFTLYSNGCPNCRLLKGKLDELSIPYVEVNDVQKMIDIGLTSVPVLEVNGKMLQFNEALNYIRQIGVKDQ